MFEQKEPSEVFCNNCGKYGHSYKICKMPITSIGIIAFRLFNNQLEFLMIRRKDTLGYVDFSRGKFSTRQKSTIINMIKQMTNHERMLLLTKYDQVKKGTLLLSSFKEKIAEIIEGVTIDGEFFDLKTLIEECSDNCWDEPEWGFPKGRRNALENDYHCAIREFSEETGYNNSLLQNIRNILPFEETFTGSNYNSYRHKYYLCYMSVNDSVQKHLFQKSEVSAISWKPFQECLQCIRPYNLEKKKVLQNVHDCLQSTLMFSLSKNNIDRI